MPRTVICISHATGSGGEEVGRLVAERLGFLHVDDQIVADAAARGGISPADVADEERRKSFAHRILGSISNSATVAASGGLPIVVDDWPAGEEIQALIREAIEQTAGRGNVVITAHAASHALEPGERMLRVLVTASPRTRAQRVGEQAVKTSDAGRRDYLKRFYGIAEELPTHYDLVVNTDGLSVEEAAALVERAAAG